MPEPDLVAIELEPGSLPEPSTFHPKRVVEFPPMELWPKDAAEDKKLRLETACRAANYRTEHDQARCIYRAYLAACPANMVGAMST